MHIEPRGRDADLARVEEDAVGDPRNGQVEDGVGEHDGRRFASKLQTDPFQIALGGVQDRPPSLSRAGEGDLVHASMSGQRRAGLIAVAGDQVDHPGRQPRLHHQLAEADGGQRGVLGRLQHHGAACSQGRRQLHGGQHQGRVPGHDGGDHPHRLSQGPGLHLLAGRLVVDRGVYGAPLDGQGLTGEIAELGDRTWNLRPAADEQGFALVQGLQFGEFVDMRFENVGDGPEDARPLHRRHGGPGALLKGVAR